MNNHHLFQIRADAVTQFAAHLAAGIVALALIASVFAPSSDFRPDDTPAAPAAGITLPAGTAVLAASTPVLR